MSLIPHLKGPACWRRPRKCRVVPLPCSVLLLYTASAQVRRPDDRSMREYREESPDSKGRALGNSQAERSDTSTTESKPPMAEATGVYPVAAAQARVKGWGKSPPRWWRHHRQGKRRPVQGQIGRAARDAPGRFAHRPARSRSSGRPLEVRGNSNPREMIIAVRVSKLEWTQNPAYRPSHLRLSLVGELFHDHREPS